VHPRPALRRAVIFGGPLLFYLAGTLHPQLLFGQSNSLFLGIHLAIPFLVCLLAWGLLLLVDGIDDRAATLARVLTIPFAIAYTAFATFDGIALGTMVGKANELPEATQPDAAQLIRSVGNSELEWPLYLIASSLWLAAALAAVVALRGRAPLPALVLLAGGAALFAKSHVSPWGPAGMAAFLAGAVWLELRGGKAEEPIVSGLPV
jgi:hypothetical protein